MGTMWCLLDPTPSDWCKTDAHSTDFEDLTLYDNESWNDPRDFAKPVKAISLSHDVPNASDRRLIKLENQVQRLMEAHLAPKPSVQVNKIASSCEICSGPHHTQYCMENLEQAFECILAYRRSGSEMSNKIDTFFKDINDQITGALPSDTVKNPKLNVNPTSSVSSARSYPMEDPQSSSRPLNLVNAIKTCFKPTNKFQKDQLQVKTLTVNKIRTPKPKEPKKPLEDEFKDLHVKLLVLEVLAHDLIYNAILDKYVESLELGDSKPFDSLADLETCVNLIPLYLFKKLKIGLLEETNHVFGLADRTKSYPVRIVRNVEVHIGKLKLLEDFYVIEMEKDPTCPLLVGRGFLATASAVIDCRKVKIMVGKGITRPIFRVKETDLGDEDVPYWTTLGKRESYEPRPSTDVIGARPPYYAKRTL
ncbi:MAK10-like protein [Tanacetum coccineum]